MLLHSAADCGFRGDVFDHRWRALHECSSHFVRNVSPFPLPGRFLDLSDAPSPQVVPEAAHGAALVLQNDELLVC